MRVLLPEGLPWPPTGLGLRKTERSRPRYGGGCEEAFSRPRIAVPLSSGRTRPSCGEQREKRHGCQRSSSGHGSGPTGNCMPEMPDCGQPRRTFPMALRVSPWLVRDAALDQERLRPLPFFGLHLQEQWVCAHAETRPALTQVVSKKAKAALSIAQQRSRD
jgi:hypothetical protein